MEPTDSLLKFIVHVLRSKEIITKEEWEQLRNKSIDDVELLNKVFPIKK